MVEVYKTLNVFAELDNVVLNLLIDKAVFPIAFRRPVCDSVAAVADLEGTNPQTLAMLRPGEQLQTQGDLGEFIMILFELLCGVRNANEGVKEEAREEIKKSLEEAKGIEDLRKIFESVIEALIAFC